MTESRFGSYVLGKRIAVGGMAEIFEAQRVGPGGFQKPVAIKRILPSFDERPEWRTMFTQEARIAAQLNHPNIVQVFDFGEVERSFFIAMEFVPGVDLSKMLSRQVADGIRMPLVLAVFIVREILRALQYAHTRKDASGRSAPIIHRDVSPPNVLVSYEGKIKLTDFGIAKALHSQERTTQPGSFKGKIHYTSPEQLRGEPADIRSDLFSTGVLLYILLTGHRPFDGKDQHEILAQQVKERHRTIRRKALRIPDDLLKIMVRSLKPNPEERFQKAAEFIGHLEPQLEGQSDPQLEERLASYAAHLFRGTVHRMGEPGETSSPSTDPEMNAQDSSAPTHVPEDGAPAGRRGRSPVVRPLFFGVMCGVLGYAGYYGWSWYRNQKGVTAPVPSVQVTASPAPARTPAPVATVIPKPRPTHRPAPTPAPKRTPKAAQKPVKKSPQPLLGAVTIFPDGPFATVYLDGKRLGDTPIMKSQVPIGVHRLRFENEKLGLENEISVEVEKGKELRLKEIWKENTSP